jgi:tape measure domain-containing protein
LDAVNRQSALGASQARERDAALRQLEIERRYQEVLARRPALQRAAAQAGQQQAGAIRATVGATRQAAQAQSALGGALRSVVGQGRTTLSFFQRLRGQVLELVASYGSLFAAVSLVQQAIQNDIARTGVENRLLFANDNDAEKTASDLAFVRDVADDLGQSFSNLATLYSRFTVASQAANVSAETTRNTFRGLAESFTVLGLSQDDVAGSFRAIEQSISKGAVQAEELRGQLGDRFPGAVTVFARAIGVTTGELNKLLEAGRVSSTAFEFFAEEVSRQARGTLPKATNSLQSSLNRLRTAFEDFTVAISRGGLGEQIALISRELAEFFKSDAGAAFARDLSNAFSLVVTAARMLLTRIEGLVFILKVFVGLFVGRGIAALLLGAAVGARNLAVALGLIPPAATAAAAATNGLAAATSRFALALGPISAVLGVIAIFVGDYALKAADAARQTAELEKEMARLGEATGDARTELIAINRSRLEGLRSEVRGLASEVDEARARVDELRDTLQQPTSAIPILGSIRAFRALLAEWDLEKAEEALTAAQAEERRRASEDAGATDKAVNEALTLRRDIFQRAADLQQRATEGNNAELLRTNDEFYNEYTRDAQAFADALQTILNADELTLDELLTPAQRDDLKSQLDLIQRARRDARGVIRPGSATDDKSGQRDADRRKREIEQLREAAQQEEERSVRDSLQRLTEDEATAAEARVELIKLEYRQKIAEQRKYRQEATALGQTALAAQFGANISALEGEQEQVIALEQRKTAIDNTRSAYERLDQALQNTIAKRDAEIERINLERELGLITQQQAEQAADRIIQEYQPQILSNVQALRDFIEANADALGKMFNVEEILLELDALQIKTETVVTAGQRRAQELRESFAQGASQALSSLGTGIADAIRGFGSFSDAIKNTRDAFLNFAADFLIQIGQMILQQAILNALQNSSKQAAKGGGGGFFATVGNFLAGLFHTGGVIGKGAPSYRRVNPAIFANAPRYHSGGVVGLKPDEVPTILQTGEEVLARNDPRNVMNGGGKSGTSVQIVNAIDAESVVAAGMQGNAGRQIIMNVIQANKSAFRQVLAS